MEINEIADVGDVTPDLVEAFARLIPQLSTSNPPPSEDFLRRLVASPASHLLVAHDDGAVVGTLTLVVFLIPTGTRAWIEDVVVDQAAGRRGIGTALTRRAIELSRELGAKTVELTSRPSREGANRLYRGLGFVPRETNVYRHPLDG